MSPTERGPYREAIENGFPGLVVDSIDLAGEGMDSLALTVNDEYVFRFPKLEEAAAKIRLEAVLLPVLQESLDVRIHQAPSSLGQTRVPASRFQAIDGSRVSRSNRRFCLTSTLRSRPA